MYKYLVRTWKKTSLYDNDELFTAVQESNCSLLWQANEAWILSG